MELVTKFLWDLNVPESPVMHQVAVQTDATDIERNSP